MDKDKKNSPHKPSSRSQVRTSWVKHGHNKLYASVGILLIPVILGAWALSSSSPGVPLKVGGTAPDFTFTTSDGSQSRFSAYPGRPVVLWWITTWCTSCQDGTRLFVQSYYNQYKAAGVVLLEIESYQNLGQPGPSLSGFASQYGYSGQTGWVLGEGSQEATKAYNPSSYLDYYYAISSQGIIVGQGPNLPGGFGSALQQASGR